MVEQTSWGIFGWGLKKSTLTYYKKEHFPLQLVIKRGLVAAMFTYRLSNSMTKCTQI